MLAALILGLRVKLRRTQYEHTVSASPPRADIAHCSRHVSKVPILEVGSPAPVSTDMALRVGKFFGNGAELWDGLQTDYDLWEAPQKLADELARIKTLPSSA